MKRCGLVGGGQTIINFIMLNVLICIVAKEDRNNSAVAEEIFLSWAQAATLPMQLDYKVQTRPAYWSYFSCLSMQNIYIITEVAISSHISSTLSKLL